MKPNRRPFSRAVEPARRTRRYLSALLGMVMIFAVSVSVVYAQDSLTLSVSESGNTAISYTKQKTGESPKTVPVAPTLTLAGAETINQARVYLGDSAGSSDILGIEGQTGNSGSIGNIQWTFADGLLTLSGDDSLANYQAALRQVTYQYTGAWGEGIVNGKKTSLVAPRTVEISIGSSLFYDGTGHYYEFVTSEGITWADARTAAAARTYAGRQGYLVTVSSAGEDDFIKGKLQGQGWMGATDDPKVITPDDASDDAVDKQWFWVTGPEAGTQFFAQTSNNGCGSGGTPVDGQYSNWNDNEPNDAAYTRQGGPNAPSANNCAFNEDFAHYLTNGKWNDYPNDVNGLDARYFSVNGYVVEYGGMAGDTPSDPSQTGQVTIKMVNPGINGTGDVHIFTPDGLVYDFQEVGEFLASRSADGTVIVQARQEPWATNPRASINTAVAFNVAGNEVEFYVQEDPVFYLDNEAQSALPTEDVALSNGGRIEPITVSDARSEFYIYWPNTTFAARVILIGKSHIDYGIARYDTQTYDGFLGNLDGIAKNDLTTSDGTVITPPPSLEDLKTFGDSWRVPAAESLFRNPLAVEESQTEVTPLLLGDIAPADRATAEQTCRNSGITDATALRNCTYDVAVTGDEVFVESAQVFEEAVEDLPPSVKVPAQPGETSGGAIFNADQAGADSIMIMDGDDVLITTGKSEDGTTYLRFSIYRNGLYVVGYSVATGTDIADAVAGAMAGPATPAEEVAAEEVTEAPVPNDTESTVCFDAVQGQIAWNYDGATSWEPANVNNLCRGAESSVEPARCFEQVMFGGIDYGGGTQWAWNDAVNLCSGTTNAESTIQCFVSAVEAGNGMQDAITSCQQ